MPYSSGQSASDRESLLSAAWGAPSISWHEPVPSERGQADPRQSVRDISDLTVHSKLRNLADPWYSMVQPEPVRPHHLRTGSTRTRIARAKLRANYLSQGLHRQAMIAKLPPSPGGRLCPLCDQLSTHDTRHLLGDCTAAPFVAARAIASRAWRSIVRESDCPAAIGLHRALRAWFPDAPGRLTRLWGSREAFSVFVVWGNAASPAPFDGVYSLERISEGDSGLPDRPDVPVDVTRRDVRSSADVIRRSLVVAGRLCRQLLEAHDRLMRSTN